MVFSFFVVYVYFPSLHCSLVVNFLHLDSDPPGVEVLADFITGDVPVTEIT